MKLFFRIILVYVTVATYLPVTAKAQKPSIAPEPLWTVKNNIDYNKTSLNNQASEGSLNVYFETQISLGEHTKFVRQCKKIISQSGVQNESTITVSFNPLYQKLFFHSIKIIRNGETINKLQLSKIKILHQEENLKDFIYNGTMDAVLILEDVRQGDFIEYSYSTKGFNPVFKDKYSGGFDTEFSVPIYDLFYRVLVPNSRSITIKNTNETIQPVIKDSNNQKIYEWRKSNIPPLDLQDNTPSWYDPFGRITFTEFKSWKEVNDWAMELFPLQKKISPELQKKIEEIAKQYTTDADRVAASLRFVQDDIRYMGIEMGANSHKPADPSKVFAQRFGDCKEKSYLLCTMLKVMNIEANAVLISTEDKKELFNMLPAPVNFDHVTVVVKIDGTQFWFDPTIAYQRGNVKEIFYPDYQCGLVIGENTTALTAIPFRNISYQHITDYFKVDEMHGSGKLVVTTNFKGDEADVTRKNYSNESISDIQKNNTKFYSKYYEEIKSDSLIYKDNDSTGVFTTTEYYTIPSFWKNKDNVKKFDFWPFAIAEILNRPKDKDRKMPLGISYPMSYKEDVTVVLPEDWNITTSETHIKNEAFTYNSEFYCVENKVHLNARYETHKDFISADESSEYLKNLKEYDDNEYYSLSYGNEVKKKKGKPASLSSTILSLLAVIIIVAGLLWWSQRRRR